MGDHKEECVALIDASEFAIPAGAFKSPGKYEEELELWRDGTSISKIAKELHLSKNAVRTRLYRIRLAISRLASESNSPREH